MSNIEYTEKNGIAIVKFNRPEKLNSLTLLEPRIFNHYELS